MPPRPPPRFFEPAAAPTPRGWSKQTCKFAVLTQHTCHARSIPAAFKEAVMLNPTSLLADALGRNLAETYRRIYGDQEPRIPAALDEAARLVIEPHRQQRCPLSRLRTHSPGYPLRPGHLARPTP